MANTFQSFSRRLSRRIILIVLVTLAPGSTLFLYTDGLTEAANASWQLFGTDRIQEEARKICERRQCEPRKVIETMREAVGAFVGGASQSDDLTMLAVRYMGNNK